MEHSKKISDFVDSHKDEFIDLLRQAVAIKNVSADPSRFDEHAKMITLTKNLLESLGAKIEVVDPNQYCKSSQKLPSIIFGQLGNDPNKKTLLIYGHLDVQPADKSDGWDTDPWELTEKNGKLYGRGSTDDKGPVLAWAHAIRTLKELGIEIPINLKFVFECMEESCSVGLEDTLIAKKDFLADVDFNCISDSYWLGTEKPCLTYGLRGNMRFNIEVECSTKDLHSGLFGGTIHEAMTDLIALMATLVDEKGKIKVPGVYDDVEPVTPAEEAIYDAMDFDLKQFCQDAGVSTLIHDCKKKTLMNNWRFPSLSLHGIEGAYSGPGHKTVIPYKVVGKFTIRLVPNMDPNKVEKQTIEYLENIFKQRNSPNKLSVTSNHPHGKAWKTDPTGVQFEAGKIAFRNVYGKDCDLTRIGGSIPVVLTLEEMTQKSCLLLPLGSSDDGAHSQNEKIDIRNYIQGAKVLAEYILNLGNLAK